MSSPLKSMLDAATVPNGLWVDSEIDLLDWPRLIESRLEVDAVRSALSRSGTAYAQPRITVPSFMFASTVAIALQQMERRPMELVIADGAVAAGTLPPQHAGFARELDNATLPGFALALALAQRDQSVVALTSALRCVVFFSSSAGVLADCIPDGLPIPLECVDKRDDISVLIDVLRKYGLVTTHVA